MLLATTADTKSCTNSTVLPQKHANKFRTNADQKRQAALQHTPTPICITVSTNLRHRKLNFCHLFTVTERLKQTNSNVFQTVQLHCNANSGGIDDTMSKEATYNTTRDPYLCATDSDPISAHITAEYILRFGSRKTP
jgi:hypothetical protein